jgi:preprotein translocase subunit SecE
MAQAAKVMNEEAQGPSGRQEERKSPAWLEKLLRTPRRFRAFLHEVRLEVMKVTWPTWDDVKATTVVVIITVFVFGLYLFLIDLGAGSVVDQILKMFRK